jgi:hypothetical protein
MPDKLGVTLNAIMFAATADAIKRTRKLQLGMPGASRNKRCPSS